MYIFTYMFYTYMMIFLLLQSFKRYHYLG